MVDERTPIRLAVVISHPTQYTSPWFKEIARHGELAMKVFYLWDFGTEERWDPKFRKAFRWDIPLLEGYEWELVPNRSSEPGTHHFFGLDNPTLARRVAQFLPDVVLTYGFNFLSHLRLMTSFRLRNTPFIVRGDSHELNRRGGLAGWCKRLGRRILFQRYYGALAVGNASAEYFRLGGISESRIARVPHCVDNERFSSAEAVARAAAREFRSALGIQSDASVVMFAGKFDPEKRPLDLLRAFVSLPSDSRSSRALIFVGSGELEGALRSEISKSSAAQVFVVPFKNQSEMPVMYAAADVLVLPSVSETWGLAVNEAMAMGVPAITSDRVGCHPDLIIPGVTGWVFEHGDIGALASVLSDALKSRNRLHEMGSNARTHIRSFSYEEATACLVDFLLQIRTGMNRDAT